MLLQQPPLDRLTAQALSVLALAPAASHRAEPDRHPERGMKWCHCVAFTVIVCGLGTGNHNFLVIIDSSYKSMPFLSCIFNRSVETGSMFIFLKGQMNCKTNAESFIQSNTFVWLKRRNVSSEYKICWTSADKQDSDKPWTCSVALCESITDKWLACKWNDFLQNKQKEKKMLPEFFGDKCWTLSYAGKNQAISLQMLHKAGVLVQFTH